MMRSLLCAVALTGCIGSSTSTAEQELCAIEDWQIGECPDSAWRVRYAIDYAQSQYPDVAPLAVSVECRDHGEGVKSCYVRLDLELVVITVDCVWSPSTPVNCIANTDTD